MPAAIRISSVWTVFAAAGFALAFAAALSPSTIALPWLVAVTFAAALGARVFADAHVWRRPPVPRGSQEARAEAQMLSVRFVLLQQRMAELQAQFDALSAEAARLRESAPAASAHSCESDDADAPPPVSYRIQPGPQLRKLG